MTALQFTRRNSLEPPDVTPDGGEVLVTAFCDGDNVFDPHTPNTLRTNTMAFAWKASGITYNRYLAVAARVVRRSLKDDKRVAAERRGEMDLRFAKWENGKQGENKSLADANAHEMAQHASGQPQ